jgi:hypothetical protein
MPVQAMVTDLVLGHGALHGPVPVVDLLDPAGRPHTISTKSAPDKYR